MGRSAYVTPQAPDEQADSDVDGADSDLTVGLNAAPASAGGRRPAAEPIRTLIVDDHALFRRGLEMVLDSEPDIELVGEASDGEEAVSKAGESLPDVVLMDIRMPRSSGIEACRALKELVPSAKIVMLTISDEEEDLFEAIRAGASGYLLKDIPLDEVADTVRAVYGGQSLINPSMAGKLLTEVRRAGTAGRVRAAAAGPRAKADRSRDPGPSPGSQGDEQQGYREGTLHLREHSEEPRPQHPGEAADPLPDGGRHGGRSGEADRVRLTSAAGLSCVLPLFAPGGNVLALLSAVTNRA